MSTETQTTTASTTPVEPKNTRIYIGNLTPNIKEEDLVKKFEAFGLVANSKIVKKSNSIFGFVEMENTEDANKAITGLNKTEMDSQTVEVEIAKDKPRKTMKRRTTPRKPTGDATTSPNGTTSPSASTPAANGKKPTGRRNSRKPKTGNNATTSPTAATTAASTTNGDANSAEKPAQATKSPKKGRLVRARKPVVEKKDKEQSKTTLFVTGLPYSWDNTQLLEIFKDYAPKSAHIIVNKHTTKSKGFGFVEFNDEAEQQKALALNKKTVKTGDKDREIFVKVAYVAEVPTTAPETAATTSPTTPTTSN